MPRLDAWSPVATYALAAVLLAVGFEVATAKNSTDLDVSQADQASLEAVITNLIEQLGAEEYARREKAQAELRRLGLTAFDALLRAQDSEDIEIALRSRYLLRSMTIRWAHEDDPLEVKEILRGYDGKSPSERRALMDQLAALVEFRGTAALCRLVRFETSDLLSKRAALLVMRQPAELDSPVRTQLAETITRETGLSKRIATEWLRTYVETLSDAESTLERWERVTRQEERVFHQMPEETSPEIVRDLLRWQVGLLDSFGRDEEALAVIRRTIDLVDGTREQLLDAVNWLMEREAWTIVEEVADRFSERFSQSSLLLYRLAESQLEQGRKDIAEKTASLAIEANRDDHQEHVRAAYSLQERGRFQWSEREYRRVMELGPLGSLYDLQSRFLLSEMLHDLQRDLPAAQVLQEVVDVMKKDKNVAYTATRIGRDPGGVSSRMHYFFAEHHRAEGDEKKRMQQLQEGVKHDATDADVLIAMYRVEAAGQEWKNATTEHIKKAVQVFREQIRRYDRQVTDASEEQHREYYKGELASANNQLAWLVGNTEGDFDEAVRCSQRSLELRADRAGYLDTLARCYYAKGDYENAVKHQSRAVELEPHSGQIRRQLELFQRALKASNP